MEINHSANFTNFIEFMSALEKFRERSTVLTFSGNVSANDNDNDNFSINWTSEEEV